MKRLAISAILVLEVAVVDFLYWARAVTVIRDPGRFQMFEPALRNDMIVFFVPPVAAAIAMGWMLARGHRIILRCISAVVLSSLAFYVAMFIALNTWGS